MIANIDGFYHLMFGILVQAGIDSEKGDLEATEYINSDEAIEIAKCVGLNKEQLSLLMNFVGHCTHYSDGRRILDNMNQYSGRKLWLVTNGIRAFCRHHPLGD